MTEDERASHAGSAGSAEAEGRAEAGAERAESTADGSAADRRETAGGSAGRTVASSLGEITWLLSQSPNHRHSLFVADLEWLVMPALMHGQFRLFHAEGKPAGVALWAFVTEVVEQRLAGGGRIAADDWRGGDRVWLVELVAPFGNQEAMLEDLRTTALADRRFRFIRTHPNGRREVVELNGADPG